MTPEEASGLANQYTLALVAGGKVPGENAEQTKEIAAGVALAYRTLMGYFTPFPSPATIAPARTPRAAARPRPAPDDDPAAVVPAEVPATDPDLDPGDGPGAA